MCQCQYLKVKRALISKLFFSHLVTGLQVSMGLEVFIYALLSPIHRRKLMNNPHVSTNSADMLVSLVNRCVTNYGNEGGAEMSCMWTDTRKMPVSVAAAICLRQFWSGVQKLLCRPFCTNNEYFWTEGCIIYLFSHLLNTFTDVIV